MKRPLLLSAADLAALDALIGKLETTPPMTEERLPLAQAEAKRTRQRPGHQPTTLASMFQALNGQDVKTRNDDLGFQCGVVSGMLDDWLRLGEIAAPHYANRIGIILRKAKRHDLDARFRIAHDRHFADAPYPWRLPAS